MGLLKSLFGFHGSHDAPAPVLHKHSTAAKKKIVRGQIEVLEPRQLLAADVLLGSVYFEEATGDDSAPDVIQVTFEGGAAGTTLDRLVISGDKAGDGLSAGDVFFDTTDVGLGLFESVGLTIESNDGFDVTSVSVNDGGTEIIFTFSGFDAGEVLEFSIDVDEIQFVAPGAIVDGEVVDLSGVDANSLVEGAEFQRSTIVGEFSAVGYADLTLEGTYWDALDPHRTAAENATGLELDLPDDAYTTTHDYTDRTAGAVAHDAQLELATLSGWVYHDQSDDGNFDRPTEEGIGGVTVELIDEVGNSLGTTETSTEPGKVGYYEFKNLQPGKYSVREYQPAGWIDGKDTAGTHGGVAADESAGTVDRITGAMLTYGDHAEEYNFGELLVGSIAGHVFASTGPDCDVDNPEIRVAGVKIDLINATGTVIATTQTLADGSYKFENVAPGVYTVREHQPTEYYDGDEHVGSEGGNSSDQGDTYSLFTDIHLGSGVDATRYDFCEHLGPSLSGWVYHDRSDDGNFDRATEEGIGGVTMELLDENGLPTGRITVTSSETGKVGFYEFTNLAPGKYGVREYHPTDWLDGKDRAGSHGGVADPEMTGPIDMILGATLTFGDKATEYNFGELLPASIAGRVGGTNGPDCDFDNPDFVIAGVQIDLLDAEGNVLATEYTDENGVYQFTDLPPGEYWIYEHQPTGYIDGGQRVGTAGGEVVGNDRLGRIRLLSEQQAENYDFCEHTPGSIAGFVHAAIGPDCDFENPGLLLEGVQIDLLDASGNVIATTYTNAQGQYKFEGLAPGEYKVLEHQPTGYYDGEERIGTAGGEKQGDDLIGNIILTVGQHAVNYDFCEHTPGSISGRVVGNNTPECDFENPYTVIEGVQIDLYDAVGNHIATTYTDVDGRYKFEDLAPGEYQIVETQPEGYYDGGERIGTAGGEVTGIDTISEIVLGVAQHAVNYDFCEHTPGSIAGRVVASSGPDCDFDDPEIVLEGVQIDLYDGSGNLIATTYTGADGRYIFENLGPGEYRVDEHQPTGYHDGEERVGTAGGNLVAPDTIANIQLGHSQHAVNYDFCEHLGVSLSGWVYHDRSNDGNFDRDTEEGIGQVTLKLLDENGADTGRRAVTNNQGYYEFSDLTPGKYSVMEVHPTDWLDGIDTPGNLGGTAAPSPGGDMISEIMLMWGQHGNEYNFGEILPGSIRGTVHVTTTPDCEPDPNYPNIAGVTIELLDVNGTVIDTTVTDADGNYAFENLLPGVYTVREIQPEDYFDGGYHLGSGGGSFFGPNQMGDIFVGSDNHLVHYDFCEVPPAQLSGFVFIDGEPILLAGDLPDDLSSIRDGLRTSDDTPLAGVVLELRHGVSGEPIFGEDVLPGRYPTGPIRTVTDSNGYYEFTGLPGDTYAVVEVQPEGLIDNIDTQGTLGGLAVNAVGASKDPTLQKTGGVTEPELNAIGQMRLRFGEDVIFRIALPAGANSEENNFSEIETRTFWLPPTDDPPSDPPPLPPVDVPLAPPAIYTLLELNRPDPPFIGGAAGLVGYTWHLSLVNAGFPRSTPLPEEMSFHLASTRFDAGHWQPGELNEARWKLGETSGEEDSTEAMFGDSTSIPVVGDWDGDGDDEIAVYIAGRWYFDLNGNGKWDSGDMMAQLGTETDLPTSGDWDGDGKTDIAIFGPIWNGDPWAIQNEPGLPDAENDPGHHPGKEKNAPPTLEEATIGTRGLKLAARGEAREDLIDHVFYYGKPGDQPVTGDWNGDGIATIGVFQGGVWYLDVDGDGRFTEHDQSVLFGEAGTPVVGDWNGDGIDDLGVYTAGQWLLDSNGNREHDSLDRAFEMGDANDRPVAGDWDGDGVDEPGLFTPGAGEQPELRLSSKAG